MTEEFNCLKKLQPGNFLSFQNLKKFRWAWNLCIRKDRGSQKVKFKARHVLKSFTQVNGCDYLRAFAGTAKLSSIRLPLAIVTLFGSWVFLFDVHLASLNAELDENIHVEQLSGFEFAEKVSN